MLSAELLLDAYSQGFFPMAVDAAGKIGWFSPDPRGVIPLDDRFHISHGLKRTLKKSPYEITVDRDFRAVIKACSKCHGDTWISPEILASYVKLHQAGYAHSVEAWHSGELVGGLYGVRLGGAFFGESMFHRMTDASKVALVSLVEILRQGGFTLLDTQWTTPHLTQFGTHEIPRHDYLAQLKAALPLNCSFGLRLD